MAEHEALVVPFGERASQFSDTPGRSYGPDEVHLPAGELPITVNHAGPPIGIATGFTKRENGITATIKLGERGEHLLSQGHVSLSAEIVQPADPGEPAESDDRIAEAIRGAKVGDLIGVALVVGIRPAFSQARVLDVPQGNASGSPLRGAPTSAHPAMDLGLAREFNDGFSMRSVEGELARARKAWENRAEDLAEKEIAAVEGRLVAAGIPKSQWPVHTHGREQWDTHQAQQVVTEGEAAAADFEERMAELEARAARPWWRWWR